MDELYSMILKGDILTDDERAQINAMKKSYLEKYIKEYINGQTPVLFS